MYNSAAISISNFESASNFYDLFAAAADRFADRVAAERLGRDGIETLTYRDLRALAERTAAWLASRGVGAGDRVALVAENDGPWCGAYLGVLRAGAVAVPLDVTYTAPQIGRLLDDCGASAVLTTARHAGVLSGALLSRRGVAVAMIDERFAGTREPPPAPPVAAGAPAVILYTSGTTADPKGVVLTHGNLVAERSAAFQIVQVDERDAILSVLPLFHALAQMANLLLPFSVGARVVFLESVNTTELMRALGDRGITAFVCVPQFFYLLRQRIEQEIGALPLPARATVRALAAVNLHARRTFGVNPGRWLFRRIHRSLGPRLRLLVTGGARFDPEVNEALFALGFTVRQAYGLTECSGAATITAEGETHLDSVGHALPGVEIRIARARTPDPPSPAASASAPAASASAPAALRRDKSARQAPDPGPETRDPGPGEILIRGPIVMRGYYNRPDQNAATLQDGWLHTGDLGYLDGAGRLYITGRSKEVIVLASGKNIYPEEIEAHYERSTFIEELCVVGLSRPGEPTSERLHALVRPDATAMRARGIVNIRELLRFEIESLSVQLPAHKRILQYDVTLDPLPRTTTRKLKRFEIEKRLKDTAQASGARGRLGRGAGGSVAPWTDDPETARVLEAVRDVVRKDAPLTPDAHLELDLALDSMERVELLVHVTAALSVAIDDEQAQTIHTVGDLVAACRSRMDAATEPGDRVAPWERLLQQPPQDTAALEELARPKFVRTIVLFIVAKALYAVFWLFAGLRSHGAEHIPRVGPYVISPNHQSYVDPFLLVGALPFRAFRRLFFVGAAEYFVTPVMAWFARAMNVVPIDPDANLVGAMQAGAHGLRLGRALVLFPEGERSIDGTVKTFRKGAAILSYQLQAPIVPVAIDGAWDIWARGRPLNWRALLPWRGTRARLQFGPPIPAAPDPDYQQHSERVRGRIIDMWELAHASRQAGP